MVKKISQRFNRIQITSLVVMLFAVIGASILIFSKAATPGTGGSASGDASISLSPSSASYSLNQNFTVSIYVNSGSDPTGIGSVEARLSYDSNKLTFVSVTSTGGAFDTCPKPGLTGGGGSVSIACTILGGSLTGNQKLGEVNFTVKAGSGSTIVSVANSSSILRGDGGTTEIWNGSSATASYTLTGDTSGGSTGGTNAGGTNNSGTSSGTKPTATGGTTSTNKPSSSNTTGTGGTSNQTVPESSTSNSVETTGKTVSVTIKDEKGQPAIGVEVLLGDKKAITDALGVATFADVAPGTYQLSAKSKVLGSATQEVNVGSTDTEVKQVVLQLKKQFNYVFVVSLVIIAMLLMVAVGLLRRWLKNKNENKRRFNGYVMGDSKSSDNDSQTSETVEEQTPAPKTVTPKPESDDTEELAVLKSLKPKIEKTDTLEQIEKKVGAKKKISPATETNNFEPNLVTTPKTIKPSSKTAGNPVK